MEREILEEKIQDLIDGRLSDTEAKAIHMQMDQDEDLMLFYNALKEVNSLLQESVLANPSEKFTENVMQGLYQPIQKYSYLRSSLIFVGLVIFATVGLLYTSQISAAFPKLAPLNTDFTILEKIQINLPAINLPSYEIFFNSIYFGLLFIALFVFDQMILKQLFRNNRYNV
jgi:hypothetical protein